MDDHKTKQEKNNLSDTQLEHVNGGAVKTYASCYMKVKNTSTYSSGSEPKYQAGQILTIKYHDYSRVYDCRCIVLSVSSTANYGLIYEEFGYDVEITSAPDAVIRLEHDMIGKVYRGVYESCLYASI